MKFQYFQPVCPIFTIWRLKYNLSDIEYELEEYFKTFQSGLATRTAPKSVRELDKVNTDAPQLFEIFLNLTRNRNPGKQVIGKKREESFLKEKPEKS